MTHRHAIKEEPIAINCHWLYNQAYRLLHNTYLQIMIDFGKAGLTLNHFLILFLATLTSLGVLFLLANGFRPISNLMFFFALNIQRVHIQVTVGVLLRKGTF